MRNAVVLVSILAFAIGACGGGAAASGEIATIAPSGEPIVIRLSLVIADASGAEIVATGEVLEGSTLGGEPFCVGGDHRGSPRKR